MSRTAVGAFTVALLCKKFRVEGVWVEPDGARDAVASRVAFAAAALQHLLLAQDVAMDDLTEGLLELPDAVGVDKGVDHRVGMGEDDGHVHDPKRRTLASWAEEAEAVDDVQRQPADSKQAH